MAQAFAPLHSLPRSRRGSACSQTSRQHHRGSTDITSSVSSLTASTRSAASPTTTLGNGTSHPAPSPSERSRSPSPAMEALPETVLSPSPSSEAVTLSPPVTSTPHRSRSNSGLSYNSVEDELTASSSTYTHSQQLADDQVNVPVLGYEVMEERARFTVFKLNVMKNENDSWIIFRRYTDFARLNDQLRVLFPHFRLALPPKKWFGDNFDAAFLDDRMQGLQAFLTNITSHPDVRKSEPVRKFLCIDEPPGNHETLEESRALCESMEEHIYALQQEVVERESVIEQLHEELSAAQQQIDALTQALRSDSCRALPSGEARRDSTASAPGVVGTLYSSLHNSPLRQVRTPGTPVSPLSVSLSDGGGSPGAKSGGTSTPGAKNGVKTVGPRVKNGGPGVKSGGPRESPLSRSRDSLDGSKSDVASRTTKDVSKSGKGDGVGAKEKATLLHIASEAKIKDADENAQEQKEKEQKEQKGKEEKEQKEKEEREQKEKEKKEKEQREKEDREQKEKEDREQKEKEQKEKEQREKEDREQKEKEENEQREKEKDQAKPISDEQIKKKPAESEQKTSKEKEKDETLSEQNRTPSRHTPTPALETPKVNAPRPNASQGSIDASPAVSFFIGTPLGTSAPGGNEATSPTGPADMSRRRGRFRDDDFKSPREQ